MKEGKLLFSEGRIRKAARVLARLLAAVAFLNFAAGVYWWFFHGFTWDLGLFEISVHQWKKSWNTGIALWLLCVLVRPGPFLPPRLFSWLFDPWDKEGESSPARSWAVFGVVPAFAAGLFIAGLYGYILPTAGHAVLLALLLCPFSCGLHALFAWTLEKLPLLVYRKRRQEYRSGLRSGLYLLVLLALVRWPGGAWEGKFYDPIWPLAAGAGLGIVTALGMGVAPRLLAQGKKRLLPLTAWLCVLLVFSAISIFWFYGKSWSGETPRDRVLFITMDTTRADHLSCYGYDRKTSPFVDKIAEQGARFENAICPMGTTDPSHVSMFTGAYPRSHGVIDVTIPITGNVNSLPAYFQERGFKTAAIVSRVRLGPANTLHLPGFDYENTPSRSRHPMEASAPSVFRRAANYISRHRHEKVFIWAHFFDPHMDYEPHPGFSKKWTDSNYACQAEHWPEEDKFYSPEEVQRCRDLYDGEIAYMDYWIERLVTWVRELEPQSERPPLVVLISDHGESLGEYQDRSFHYGFGHEGMIHQKVARIPLIISWPGRIPEGKVVGGLAETVDLAPTLTSYIFGSDFNCQGQNLKQVIEGKTKGDDIGHIQRFMSEGFNIKPYGGEPRFGVYKGPWKLMHTPERPPELYNVNKDPLEKNDKSKDRPERTEELLETHRQWKEETPRAEPGEREDDPRNDALRALGYIQD